MKDTDEEDPGHISAAMMHVFGAMSSLNMPPRPVEHPGEGAQFLSELDERADHAMGHLHRAVQALSGVSLRLDRLDGHMFQARVALTEVNANDGESENDADTGAGSAGSAGLGGRAAVGEAGEAPAAGTTGSAHGAAVSPGGGLAAHAREHSRVAGTCTCHTGRCPCRRI